jgi:hypothetical protein
MAAFKTLKLLPSVFRTQANSKFLNATLDQLVAEPTLERINGYIGRRLTGTFQTQGSFIQEPTTSRQHYQLEPSVIVKQDSNIDFSVGYLDFINKIRYLGGNTQNHSRMFENEFYSFDGLIDFDKFVNFNQYYWVPEGLDAVEVVLAAGVDIQTDILGQTEYETENSVKFTNGLKIKFDNTVLPASYRNSEYYIEGIGVGIQLVLDQNLINPGPLASEYVNSPDYITINRASADLNPWTRSNRWFHIDVINATAEYNKTEAIFNQSGRSIRPIIEFQANVQLFNYGKTAKAPVDLIDFTVTDLFSTLEGSGVNSSIPGSGVALADGMRIIFAAESDLLVKDKIYQVSFIDPAETGTPQLHFSLAADSDPVLGETVLVSSGAKTAGNVYNYTTSGWQLAQQKTKLQQNPKFDVFDQSGISFSDQLKYPNNNFAGTSIFSYQLGTGRPDKVLGFPLTYRNINNIGDIVFDNNFDRDSFIYTQSNETREIKVNTGFLHVNTGTESYIARNIWNKVSNLSFQYQVISYDVSGTSYRVDIEPVSLEEPDDFKVYLDNQKLKQTEYTFVPNGKNSRLEFTEQVIADKSRLTILIKSNQVSSLGFYQIPLNLEFNAENKTFDSLTLGQMRGHVQTLFDNLSTVDGVFPGSSNLRDIGLTKNTAGSILQHSAGLPYAMLFLTNEKIDFIAAIQQASFDYSKFRYKFLDLAGSISEINLNDIPASVDEILNTINEIKTPDFAYYASDMLAYGEKVVFENEISFIGQVQFGLPESFDLKKASFRSVLVYFNGEQLLESRDYTFIPDSNAVVLSDSLDTVVGDKIRVEYFENTLGSWIPATPSKLGLWPRYQPEIFLDDTLLTPLDMIRGHDGSLTPAFGDFRDQMLLELEKRIYNNIKSSYDLNRLNLFDVLPGKARDTGYSLEEINQILSSQFFKWSGANRLSYATNSIYDRTNPFTYNYRRSSDKLDNSILPGSWRAVSEYYFDTTRPHTHPWEMLGFADKPQWWESEYGAAPYTSANTNLWTDLSLGTIAQGERAGVDQRFARPFLLDMIPVDTAGNLLAPADFIVKVNTPSNAETSWAVGDQGPVETAWRRSSEFPFAAQMLLAVTKPARFFGENIDREQYNKTNELDQYLFATTKQRLTTSDIKINGSVINSQTISKVSYINWIADFVLTQSQNPIKAIESALNNFEIQLSYKMAAYSDKKYLKVFAEQVSPTSTSDSIVVPDEDFKVHLQKSTPINKIRYSGVIVTKTTTGYRVDGLDINRPYFSIVPSMVNNNNYSVTVLKYSGVVYRDYKKILINVPYGYEFATRQQIFDFLVSYGRYLNSQGFVFSELLDNFSETRNWVLSGKEFLFWSQQGWPDNSMIFLSPVGTRIKLRTNQAIVGEIQDFMYSSRVLDQNLRVITKENYAVNRQDNEFSLETSDERIIGFLEVDSVQFEHALIFNNTTMFNDIIYAPELGSRQSRMKLVGFRTSNWNGTLAPAGFIFNQDSVEEWTPGRDYVRGTLVRYKNQYYTANQPIPASDRFDFSNWKSQDYSKIKKGLIPNFANSAENFTTFYDVNGINLENQYDLLGKGLIGYRSRKYFADLGIDDTSQVKFYQGFIREKGTQRSFDALIGAEFDNTSSEIITREEWAVRVGEYGAVDSRQVLEVSLDERKFTANPSTLELISDSDETSVDRIGIRTSDLYRKPKAYSPSVFLNLETTDFPEFEIKTAGYLQVSDVDFTIYDLSDSSALEADFDLLGVGKTVWVARDFSSDWNVFRISETNTTTRKITNRFDGTISVLTDKPHNLVNNDVIVLKNFTNGLVFNGVYKVVSIINSTEFAVEVTENLSLDDFIETEPLGALYKMQSLRFTQTTDIVSATPPNGWRTGERFFIDQYAGENHWAVFEKTQPWANSYNYADNIPNVRRGSAVAINEQSQYALIGSSEYNTGQVVILGTNAKNVLRAKSNLQLNSANVLEFGAAMALKQTTGVIGAPGSASNRGFAVIIDVELSDFNQIHQIFTTPDDLSNGRFGESVAISSDTNWVYVAAPAGNKVYAYTRIEVPENLQQTITLLCDGSTLAYNLGFAPLDDNSITVRDLTNRFFVKDQDFTISGSNIVFFDPPEADSSVIVAQQPWFYKLVGVITSQDSGPGDGFGHNISTSGDGSRIVIGAPYHEYVEPPLDSSQLTDVGSVYVFDRSIEAFFGGPLNYQATDEFAPEIAVRVNNEFKIQNQDFTVNTTTRVITFTQAPAVYDKVYLETNNFTLVDKFKSITPEKFNNFGFSVALCKTDCGIFVGSPNTDVPDTNSGSVYRYINSGKLYGVVTGTVENPSLTNGDTFRINDFKITVTASDVDTLAIVINNRQIPGVTAEVLDDKIQIQTTSDSEYDKLKIAHGSGTVLSDLGIKVYELSQVINNPQPGKNEYFGEVLALSPDSRRLFVGSPSSTSRFDIAFDNGRTTFDVDSTRVVEAIRNSGSVQVFEVLSDRVITSDSPSKMAFGQSLISNTLSLSDSFGKSIAPGNSTVMVGAPTDSSNFENQGVVNIFENASGKNFYELSREKLPRVSVDSINKVFVYNRTNNKLLASLDFIDPVKGKLFGKVAQNLDYITPYDPARYNQTSFDATDIRPTQAWGTAQVGKFWWNLDTARFLDYEQDSVTYRAANWAKLFPSSKVEIYEWISSTVPPSEYPSNNGLGVPKSVDDSAYCQEEYVDPSTGTIAVRYYYWVKNRNTVTDFKQKTLTSAQIATWIENPQTYSAPYAAVLQDNAISLYNVNSYVSASDSILHVDYDVKINDDNLHTEFELIAEGSDQGRPSKKILDKFQDSLAGINALGQAVPDTSLSAPDQIGVLFRPRQTVFINRLLALKQVVSEVNKIFAREKIAEDFNLNLLNSFDPIPRSGLNLWDDSVENLEELNLIDFGIKPLGYKILVKFNEDLDGRWCIFVKRSNTEIGISQVQSYDVRRYWEKVNWFAEGYSETTVPKYIVANRTELIDLEVEENDLVKVLDNGKSQFLLLRARVVDNEIEYDAVGIQRGTIRLLPTLYENPVSGFDSTAFELGLFDESLPQIEVRFIFQALRTEILIDQLNGDFNKLFFVLLKYAVSEQPGLDWAFKTSFISVFHKIRKLEEFPTFRRDNQQFLLDYLSEAKPYRTKIREYVLDYDRTDISENKITDFDPLAADTVTDWQENYTMHVGSISVIDGGSGYTSAPTVEISGGGGSDAQAVAAVVAGEVVSVTVTEPGSGYTSRPSITFTGGEGTNARAYVQLENTLVRHSITKIKLDRVNYAWDIHVEDWAPNTVYQTGDIITYAGEAYQVQDDFTSGAVFSQANLSVYADEDFETANDRIWAYYQPKTGNVPRDLKLLLSGLEYPGTFVNAPAFTDSSGFDTKRWDRDLFDSVVTGSDTLPDNLLDNTIQSSFLDTNLGLRPEDVIVDGAAFVDTFNSHAPEELIPGQCYDTLDLQVYTVENLTEPAPPIAFRIFQNMIGEKEYFRISQSRSTVLAEPLEITDTEIAVVDASVLAEPDPLGTVSIPGVVFINGERITYFVRDLSENKLKQIRRGTFGTGAPTTHPAGTTVVDAHRDQKIPQANDFVWYSIVPGGQLSQDGSTLTVLTTELGLQGSSTLQASFLKADAGPVVP